MFRSFLFSLTVATLVTAQTAAPTKVVTRWPATVREVGIPCSDAAVQKALWYAPESQEKKPLLVGLHSWSSTYASAGGDVIYADWCIAQSWAFIHPDFRGPNWTPAAMGSDRAVADVVEAVAWAKTQTAVDESRIYLVGSSGGGHMALLMAGRHPELWAGVSAWCGISDVAQWHRQHQVNGKSDRYAQNIEAALGHVPQSDDAAAMHRSPLAHLSRAATVPLDICHGFHDGRAGSVPFTHSLLAFNATVAEKDRLPTTELQAYYDTETLPTSWPTASADPTYATWTPRFRKTAGHTRVTIFEGGHEIVHQAALNWLALQRRGQAPVWTAPSFIPLASAATQSGK